ncbi:LytTR family DNA-binding domain-containing protein [Fulvivirga maritima]|uniref:LytR/AlgR family response regulator transcription factor n=1 Tax=Fulvivirga maritima TaxID=2904247 RepID=UPI001F2E0A2F|nr:LytTR family DNA-binding domain-containing protein [Fulvivirga maritima]UII28277.1 LytTR family DNA-binding domain-containing protein [Fulvivirga maritima]
MNVLIVEDEPLAAERLSGLIHQYDADVRVIEELDTVKSSAAFIDKHSKDIDLIFLDIQLSDGKCFEIFQKIECYKPVIFTTAYDDYMLQAFKTNSLDYLLKPVNYNDLQAALERYKKIKNEDRTLSIDQDTLKSLLGGKAKNYKCRFLVKFGKRMQFKNVDEIAYITANDKICHIVERKTGNKYIIDHTLEELDESLLDPNDFFRINRQYIISIACIREISPYDQQRLRIILNVPCEEKLIVSRGKVPDFKKWLNA